MRKGSIKLTTAQQYDQFTKTGIISEEQLEKELFEKYRAIFTHEINPVQDILLRLCDACHEMDTRTEPWASIRKDIERLK